MNKQARIESLTNALINAADEMLALNDAELAQLWTELCTDAISISTAKRDVKAARPAAVAARQEEQFDCADSDNAQRVKIADYLRHGGDTIKGIAAGTGIHPRTVRATILAGAGSKSATRKGRYGLPVARFECVGMVERAKVWAVAA